MGRRRKAKGQLDFNINHENIRLAVMDYGREMQFFDGHNSLSEAGQLLAETLLSST